MKNQYPTLKVSLRISMDEEDLEIEEEWNLLEDFEDEESFIDQNFLDGE